MELSDIFSFIDHWHKAVGEELHEHEEKAKLESLAKHLKEDVRRTLSLRNLATSPLLCAMLCALNQDRRQQLPEDRIELYEACCYLLIERRDKEQRIELSEDYPALKYRQKRLLLEDLSYWMIRNDWSEVALQRVDERFGRILENMPSVSQDASGSGVRRLFVERAGIIREPVVGQIDFTHRTFQEFLAAQAACDELDIGVLIEKASSVQWRELIILASGLASKQMREELIRGLIKHGDEASNTADKEHRYQYHVLAISCLETSLELGQNLKVEVEKRLSQLVPPKDMIDAKALAAAGEWALKYLAKGEHSASITAACVRTLGLIGGDEALEKLEEYAYDTRQPVIDELVRAWDSFDRDLYARRILSQTFRNSSDLRLERLSSLDGIQYLTILTRLDLFNCSQLGDLRPLMGLPQLKRLSLPGCSQISDLSPLANLEQLTRLDLSGCSQISDLSPLANLPQLMELDLSDCSQVSDSSPLAGLINLTSLNLSDCSRLSTLNLTGLVNLTSLNLLDCPFISSINLTDLIKLPLLELAGRSQLRSVSLSGLISLKMLSLSSCSHLSTISLIDLPQLLELDLSGSSHLSIFSMTNLRQLTSLTLSDFSQVSDLSLLVELKQLTSLTLSNCSQLNDLSALASLRQLTSLTLSGLSQVSTISLMGLEQLTSLTLSDCPQVSYLRLTSLTELTSLNVHDCSQLSNLNLTHLSRLTHLDLFKSFQLNTLSLTDLPRLKSLILPVSSQLRTLNRLCWRMTL